ncbi:MAG: vWA domain-containing protein [Bacteroidota bacterium]
MKFIWPSMLLLFLLVPLLMGLYLLARWQRRRRAEAYGSLGLLQGRSRRGPGFRLYVPPALFLLSLTALLFASARPKFTVALPSMEGTVVLVFDVSGSMGATDVEPSRMEAAKNTAVEFVKVQPAGVQVGVVAFSDSGLSVVAPTNDRDTIVAAIKRLSPQRGTSLANGITSALDLLSHKDSKAAPPPSGSASPVPAPAGSSASGVIVLLTDGENNMSPDPLEAARKAAEAGVRVDAIGFGTPAGVTMKVNGFMVHTQLDEAALRELSKAGGGSYYNPQGAQDLKAIYSGIEPEFTITPQDMEVTSLFAALGMVILVIGGAFSLLWFGRVL